MAITRAQAYQQLVRKPSGEERPGYRGPGGYQGGATNQGGAGKGGEVEDKGSEQQNRNQRNIVAAAQREKRIKDVEKLIDRPSILDQIKSIPNTARKYGLKNSLNYNLGINQIKGPIGLSVMSSLNPGNLTAQDYMNIANDPSLDQIGMTGKDLTAVRDKINALDKAERTGITQSEFEKAFYGPDGKPEQSGGGDGGQIFLPQTIAQAPSITDQEPEQTELQQLIASMRSPGGIATRFLAEGGMADEFIGGAADGGLDAMGRQMYGLGKIVKKATRAVKKIAKSPVGKIALAVGLNYAPTLFDKPTFLSSILGEGAKKKSFMDMIGGKPGLGILGVSALAGLTAPDEDEDQPNVDEMRGQGLDLAAIRANPNMYLAPRFQAQEGGKAEPVAKKVMPLLDMDGMEKDYRETGGFVPIGRMEKADDVPARLSKNEFVFTADAVRNAGDGDIDKGAEVMYNMMKHLEDGGDVSEESQGLEGARNMFQTSQRLEEVL